MLGLIEDVIRGHCTVHCTNEKEALDVFQAISLAKGELPLMTEEDVKASRSRRAEVRSVRCSGLVVIADYHSVSVPSITYDLWVSVFDMWSERYYKDFPHLKEEIW